MCSPPSAAWGYAPWGHVASPCAKVNHPRHPCGEQTFRTLGTLGTMWTIHSLHSRDLSILIVLSFFPRRSGKVVIEEVD
jgi:hypothetical protein